MSRHSAFVPHNLSYREEWLDLSCAASAVKRETQAARALEYLSNRQRSCDIWGTQHTFLRLLPRPVQKVEKYLDVKIFSNNIEIFGNEVVMHDWNVVSAKECVVLLDPDGNLERKWSMCLDKMKELVVFTIYVFLKIHILFQYRHY